MLAGTLVYVILEGLNLGVWLSLIVVECSANGLLKSQQFAALGATGAQVPVRRMSGLFGKQHAGLFVGKVVQGRIAVRMIDKLNEVLRRLRFECQCRQLLCQCRTGIHFHLIKQVVDH